ncbi:MAG: hypothetical protein GDA51_06805 [Ekhidna sp.]|nr:hypothetical protein [Ekhidna sp.]MBC6409667.1 hypothetical protein [Ekhidna sp.]MBC6426167.1 hypothetical protein [Ekhidna sp.]
MLKVLLILILIIYVFYKTAGFLFRLIFGPLRTDSGSFQRRGQYSKKAPNSKLNIDKIPEQRTEKSTGYKGGDYIDFEEVK